MLKAVRVWILAFAIVQVCKIDGRQIMKMRIGKMKAPRKRNVLTNDFPIILSLVINSHPDDLQARPLNR